jgi:excisionase family DNA binding protein
MGQVTLSDHLAVPLICERVWILLQDHVLPGGSVLLREFPDLSVEGTSFRSELRLLTDRLGWQSDEARTLVAIRFGPPGEPLPPDPKALYVRVDWPERVDRLPELGRRGARRFRKHLAPKRSTSGFVVPSDILIPAAGPSRETVRDVESQLALFLLQTDVLSEPGRSDVAQAFTEYLQELLKLKRGDDVIQATFEAALRRFWWPPSATAWRAFLRTTARYRRLRLAEREPAVPRTDTPLLTVDGAVRLTRIPRSTLYALIQQRRIRSQRDSEGRVLVGRDEVLRYSQRLTKRTVIDRLVRERGLKRDAARKRVQRWKGTLADLFSD